LSEFYGRKKKKQLTVIRQGPFQSRTKIGKSYSDYYLDSDYFIDVNEDVGIGVSEIAAKLDYLRPFRHRLEIERNLKLEVESLRKIVSILYSKFDRIENRFPECVEAREVVYEAPVDKEVSIDEAKPLIQTFLKEYFKRCKKVYPSDVADELGVDYDTVREVFAMLEREGKLKLSD
jgi:hypothetical protein